MSKADQTAPPYVPPAVQRLIAGLELTEQTDPNPTTRPGERPLHQRALRRWTGGRATTVRYLDDGYDLIEVAGELAGWRPSPRFGDWPMVVEFLKVHDPKDDDRWYGDPAPTPAGSYFRYYRLTYLEGATYLAEYPSLADAKVDAWPNPDGEGW
jgi:hypothetical protein